MNLKSDVPKGSPAAVHTKLAEAIARYKGLIDRSESSIYQFETGLTEVKERLGVIQNLEISTLETCRRVSQALVMRSDSALPLADESKWDGIIRERDEIISKLESNPASVQTFIDDVKRIDGMAEIFLLGSRVLKSYVEILKESLDSLQSEEIPQAALGDLLDKLESNYEVLESKIAETSVQSTELCGMMTNLCRKMSGMSEQVIVWLRELTRLIPSQPTDDARRN